MENVKDIALGGKRALVRVDFNVPLGPDREVIDDARIRGALPTLQHILNQDGRLIVASHLGRPKGRRKAELSLLPVAGRLAQLLGRPVALAADCIGGEVRRQVGAMDRGEVVLLENLRFHPQEQLNDDAFAKALASLCDVYVNDAFAVSHRANASVAAITRYAPVSLAGLLLEKEISTIRQAMANPRRPLLAIVGGAKVSTKLAALEHLVSLVDKIIIGGAMANTFLSVLGHEMGQSLVEKDLLDAAGAVMRKAAERGVRFYLPVDVAAAAEMDPAARVHKVPVQELAPDWMALDIGPATALLYTEALHDAGTIVWNGPMGVCEMAPFSKGTMAMAHALADSPATTIVGGGDTDAAIHQSGRLADISYISTGGGAFLALLEGKTLPALAALSEAQSRFG